MVPGSKKPNLRNPSWASLHDVGSRNRVLPRVNTMEAILKDLRLDGLAQVFEDNDVDDLPTLEALDEADLKEMGMKLGVRRALMSAVKGVQFAPGASTDLREFLGKVKLDKLVETLMAEDVDSVE